MCIRDSVDGAEADFTGVDEFKADGTGTQSAVCLDGSVKGQAAGLTLTQVDTKDGQTAYVPGDNLAQFVAAKDADPATKVETITLNEDVTLTANLYLQADTKVVGNGKAINGSAAIGKDNVVTVMGENVNIENVTIRTCDANKSALHVYKTTGAVLKDVTLDASETAGGAGLVVNASTVTVEGVFNLVTRCV